MTPLALVTGFLGSGKTTFLRHLSADHAGRRLGFVVNDFAAADIDAQALSDLQGEVVSLPGGSVFCRCLARPFTDLLRDLAGRTPTLEGVVLEASGMADPRAVADLLCESRLDRLYRLSAVVALATPETIHKLLAVLPAVRSQIETADVVLLNKTDLLDEAAVARAEGCIRGVRGDVPILRCVQARASIRLFEGRSDAVRIHVPPAACRDESFCSATVWLDAGRPVDPAAVCELIAEHSDSLWRAKGFLPASPGLVELQWSLGQRQPTLTHHPAPRATARTARPALALIARGDAVDALDRLAAALKALSPEA